LNVVGALLHYALALPSVVPALLGIEWSGGATGPGSDADGTLKSKAQAVYRCVAITSADEITPHLAAWEGLEDHALEDNVYFSGPFLAAALRHLKRRRPSVVVLVYRDAAGGSDLTGVAAFEVLAPGGLCPLRTLATGAGPHGYFTFPLLHRDHAAEAFRALWDWVEQPNSDWRITLLRHVRADSPALKLVEAELARRGRSHTMRDAVRRPFLSQGSTFEQYLASLPSARRKHFRRNWRKLTERGHVEVVLHRDLATTPDIAERFLTVEMLGWKGKSRSALGSRPDDTEFFREVTRELGFRGRLFYVEVRLEGRPIAITSNFVSGQTLFAFKVAYDPALGEVSPGILNEIMGIRLFHEASGLRAADSGTTEESYVGDYWRDSIELRSFYVAETSLDSRAFVRLFPFLSRVKAALTRTAPPSHSA
jgi:CelD/BcsL family acetyltransferase involved in cellulose biosynthesis